VRWQEAFAEIRRRTCWSQPDVPARCA
jgi:hypothetical protein